MPHSENTTMAWEERKGNLYYYAKRREGTKVKSIYMGRGVMAQAAEKLVEETRKGADRESSEEERTWQELAQLQDQLKKRNQQTLIEAGLHRPKRGVWRLKRSPTCSFKPTQAT